SGRALLLPGGEFVRRGRISRPGISASFQARASQRPFWGSPAPERVCWPSSRRPALRDTPRLFAGSVLSRNLQRPSSACRSSHRRAPTLYRNARRLRRLPRHSSRAFLPPFVGAHTHPKEAVPVSPWGISPATPSSVKDGRIRYQPTGQSNPEGGRSFLG